MANVILFNPLSWMGIDDRFMPFALLYSAIYVSKEYEVKIIDQRFEKDWEKKLINELKKKTLCVGITSVTGKQIKYAIKASKIVKENSTTPVVWGGLHASSLPEQTLENKYVDIVVIGEGEETFYKLIKALDKKESLKNINGIYYKENGKIKKNPLVKFINLNNLPKLPYYIVNIQNYIQIKNGKRSINILTSKGCLNKCTFCHNSDILNKSCWRAYNTERVLENIDFLVKEYKIEDFIVIDDNFFVDLNRAKKIAQSLIERKYNLTWTVIGSSINSLIKIDKLMFKLLEKSGLKMLLIGVESGSPKILKLIKKNITPQQILKVNQTLSHTNIIVVYSFMSGFPTETKEDLKMTIDLIFKLKKDNPNIQTGNIKPVVCYPGTELYEHAIKYGFHPPKKLEDWAEISWENTSNIDWPWLSKKKRRMLNYLYYSSLLMNRDYIYINSKLYKFLTWFISPIMEYRTKNLDFRFPILLKTIGFIHRKFM